MTRFERAFMGMVVNVGMIYNIQEAFNGEGYFRVKATFLRAYLCILEESEERRLKH